MSILGFEVRHEPGLLVPYYIHNADARREALGREAGFSFPLAAIGFSVGGVVGVATGHIIGAVVGYVRHRRIHRR